MNENEGRFRTVAFGGFHRQDVLDHIERLLTERREERAALTAELEQERKKNARLQTWLMVMMVAVVVLMVVYLWDVSNLHSGLTAYFNQ